MSGTGLIDNPWDLGTALNSSRIQGGDTLLLRGGIYYGDFTTAISGNGSKIIIDAYPGEKPIIDGSLSIIGTNLILKNIEVRNTSWNNRYSNYDGSAPPDISQKIGINVQGMGIEIINCKIHDCLVGLYSSEFAQDLVCYGLTIWNNGWIGTDRTHGHAIYYHGKLGGTKYVKNCLITQDFSDYALHIYDSNSIIGHVVDKTIHATRKFLVGSAYGVTDRIAITNNCIYGENILLNYGNINSGNFILDNNYISANTNIKKFQSGSIKNNVFELGADYAIDYPLSYNPYDISGNVSNSSGDDRIIIYPNVYDNDKATIAIYNYSLAENIALDLSSLSLTIGRNYILRNGQNPFGDIINFIYVGDIISIDMKAISHSVAIPFAHNVALESTTFPQFGCFLLEKYDD